MNTIWEVLMLLSFGAAWPLSVIKSYHARTAKGKSLPFLVVLLIGYVCGIINKFVNGLDYVVWFYVLNFVMIGTDLLLYFRNKRLDKLAGIK